jgi:hypothetical protein
MSVQVSPITLPDAMAAFSSNKPESLDFYETFGIEGCTQDCDARAKQQNSQNQPVVYPEITYKQGRRQFRNRATSYRDLEMSACNGCGTCAIFKAILNQIPAQILQPLTPATQLRWDS